MGKHSLSLPEVISALTAGLGDVPRAEKLGNHCQGIRAAEKLLEKESELKQDFQERASMCLREWRISP